MPIGYFVVSLESNPKTVRSSGVKTDAMIPIARESAEIHSVDMSLDPGLLRMDDSEQSYANLVRLKD